MSQVYFNAKGCVAIGTHGLLNPGIFENVHVNCGHTEYSRLVPGIIGLLAYTQGISSAEEVKNPWIPFALGNVGDWEDLHQTNEHIIQQHNITGHFRVVEIGGIRRECFHCKAVIPLMDAIAVLPK